MSGTRETDIRYVPKYLLESWASAAYEQNDWVNFDWFTTELTRRKLHVKEASQ